MQIIADNFINFHHLAIMKLISNLSHKKKLKKILQVIANWFYVGKLKPAPGTWATLSTLPLALLLNKCGPFYHMFAIFILLVLGIVAADFYEKEFNVADNSEIVIDEVVGFLITMLWLPQTWQAYAVGFILFRGLDIFKPFPIGYLDKKVKGGMGVMVDDMAAGMIANIILQQLYIHTSWLGAQIVFINS